MKKNIVLVFLWLSLGIRAIYWLIVIIVGMAQKILLPVLSPEVSISDDFVFPGFLFGTHTFYLLLHAVFVIIAVIFVKSESNKIGDILGLLYFGICQSLLMTLVGLLRNAMYNSLSQDHVLVEILIGSYINSLSPLMPIATAAAIIGCTASLCNKLFASKQPINIQQGPI